MHARLITTGLCLAFFPLFACSAPPEHDAASAVGPAAAATAPWTSTFLESAALVAREIRIEGPPGLLEHVAVRQDENMTVSHRTVPEGLLQEYHLKPGVPGEVRAYLDKLAIAAEQTLIVLERPGPVAVTVTAQGQAMWRTNGGQERAGESLRLVGDAPR